MWYGSGFGGITLFWHPIDVNGLLHFYLMPVYFLGEDFGVTHGHRMSCDPTIVSYKLSHRNLSYVTWPGSINDGSICRSFQMLHSKVNFLQNNQIVESWIIYSKWVTYLTQFWLRYYVRCIQPFPTKQQEWCSKLYLQVVMFQYARSSKRLVSFHLTINDNTSLYIYIYMCTYVYI